MIKIRLTAYANDEDSTPIKLELFRDELSLAIMMSLEEAKTLSEELMIAVVSSKDADVKSVKYRTDLLQR